MIGKVRHKKKGWQKLRAYGMKSTGVLIRPWFGTFAVGTAIVRWLEFVAMFARDCSGSSEVIKTKIKLLFQEETLF